MNIFCQIVISLLLYIIYYILWWFWFFGETLSPVINRFNKVLCRCTNIWSSMRKRLEFGTNGTFSSFLKNFSWNFPKKGENKLSALWCRFKKKFERGKQPDDSKTTDGKHKSTRTMQETTTDCPGTTAATGDVSNESNEKVENVHPVEMNQDHEARLQERKRRLAAALQKQNENRERQKKQHEELRRKREEINLQMFSALVKILDTSQTQISKEYEEWTQQPD